MPKRQKHQRPALTGSGVFHLRRNSPWHADAANSRHAPSVNLVAAMGCLAGNGGSQHINNPAPERTGDMAHKVGASTDKPAGNRGMGRPKGSKNKTTTIAKDAIAAAADKLGGTERLVAWAKEDEANERAFWSSIYPKLLPLQVNGPGQNGEHTTRILTEYVNAPD